MAPGSGFFFASFPLWKSGWEFRVQPFVSNLGLGLTVLEL